MGGEIDTVIRPFRESDFSAALELVSAVALPIADLTPASFALAAERDGCLVGVIGLEAYGDVGLLRSLVVSRARRGGGLGARLVAALERHAATLGTSELWLLTIDADGWFERLGYAARDRVDAPADIAASEEFSSLCPGSAVLMAKRLRPPAAAS